MPDKRKNFESQIDILKSKLEVIQESKGSVEKANMKLINEADYLETNNGRLKCVKIRLNKEIIETRSKFKI